MTQAMTVPGEPSFQLAMPRPLVASWWMIVLPSDAITTPDALPDDGCWLQAEVPGTALRALSRGRPEDDEPIPLHDHDVWYRATVDLVSGERLRFCGLAGLAEIWIGDDHVASSDNMFVATTITAMKTGEIILSIRFRSLNKALQSKHGRPRWRTRLVTSNALRMYRQTLLGHMPGWCPPIHAVGPYRSVDRLGGCGTIELCSLRTVTHGGDAVLSVRIMFSETIGPKARLTVRLDQHVAPLHRQDMLTFTADLVMTDLELWWPHTHGNPRLYDVFLSDGTSELHLGRTGFRDLKLLHGEDGDGFHFEINGLPIFCRGACWTNADLLGLQGHRETYAPWLRLARDAGMNMIRVSGTMLYEGKDFHDLCDELGLLVWQDLMFANLDYPMEALQFQRSVVTEIRQLVERLDASPSLAILCGGSEMAQQSTMLGLQADRRAMPFFETVLSELLADLKPGLPYIPNSPWGGPLPISTDAGITHYYGVGAYERPLEDARRARVRFATECLAFANPSHPTSPTRQAALDGPHDPGVSWTFVDVRDHYLHRLYSIDPARVRVEDPDRYHRLSQATTADLMEAVFSEWRRPQSSCSGALVWQLQDLAPGSGWGIIENNGRPKAAWHGLRRVLAPVQVLLSDEGVNGLDVHIINETPKPIAAILEFKCINRSSVTIMTVEHDVTIQAHDSVSLSSHSLCQGFFDTPRAYRFGPAEHDVTMATLLRRVSRDVTSRAFHFPLGRALPLEDLGIVADVVHEKSGWMLKITTVRFAQAVHLDVDGYLPDIDWFHLPPLETRIVRLSPVKGMNRPPAGVVNALNSQRAIQVRIRS